MQSVVYHTKNMTEAPNFHNAADLQRVAVNFRTEKKLYERISPLYNDLARHALQNSVSFRLYPDVVTRLHGGARVGYDVDDRPVHLHGIEELKHDLADVGGHEYDDINIDALTVDFLRHRSNPEHFQALIFADIPLKYREILDRVVAKFSGDRLPPAASKLSRRALFLLIDSNNLAPDVAKERTLTQRVADISGQLGGKSHRRGDSVSPPTVKPIRLIHSRSIGLDVYKGD